MVIWSSAWRCGSKAVAGRGWVEMKAENGNGFWQQAAAIWRWMGCEVTPVFCSDGVPIDFGTGDIRRVHGSLALRRQQLGGSDSKFAFRVLGVSRLYCWTNTLVFERDEP